MKAVVCIALVCSQCVVAQHTTSKYLLDKDTKAPLRAATIHNANDYTITNDDGHFVFYSTNDSVTIKMLGYETLKTTFKALSRTKDTLYLTPKPFQLDEVTLSNKNILQEAYNHASTNYPMEPFVEDFFLRCILKRNGELVKIEDFSGRIKRDKLLGAKKNFIFQLLNMRKFGIEKKGMRADDFNIPSLNDVFQWWSNILFLDSKEYRFSGLKVIDETHQQVSHNPKNEEDNKSSIGHFIINTNDYAVKERIHKINPKIIHKIPYTKKPFIKYRTIDYFYKEKCEKDNKNNKYFIANAIVDAKVEGYVGEERIVYDVSFELIVTHPFSNLSTFKANVNGKKELFKLEVPYNKEFWETQNQLPLTNEMRNFINKAHNQKEYRVISNF
ncbi:MAG: hypothetical protein E6494_06230 [Capnocytophaga sp.]|uniref:hypothetical protein n=1 Tax=Capnocytophaga sp. TaxID=44737 RepID=UPI00280BA56D|nr:hypothetical protein [Capnocytophaga sp.]MDU6659691.1 hypothetical protein [Capnocytophaga sp.]